MSPSACRHLVLTRCIATDEAPFPRQFASFAARQSEVARLAETGEIEKRTDFPGDQTLSYSVESGDSNVVRFENDSIRVIVATGDAKRWIETDQTGLNTKATRSRS
jgi:hypothetical protein